MVEVAKKLCFKWHKGQFRKDGKTPYTQHPVAVAELLTHQYDKVVALLHDVIENTNCGVTHLIADGIPDECIGDIVLLTKSPDLTYLEYIEEICKSPRARRVKIADIMHNNGDTPSPKQREKYKAALKILLKDLK